MPSPLPYLKLYQKDVLSSSSWRRLSLAEQGLYMNLLMYQWEDGDIPDDVKDIAEMVGKPLKEVQALWPKVKQLFAEASKGRLAQQRMAEDREAAFTQLEANRENGKKGGRPPKPKDNPPVSNGKPNGSNSVNPNERHSGSGANSNAKKNVVVTSSGDSPPPPDELRSILIAAASRVPKFQDQVLDPDSVTQVIELARREAPNDDAIEDQIERWEIANSSGKLAKNREDNPLTAFTKWIDQKAPDWRKDRATRVEKGPECNRDYVLLEVDGTGTFAEFIPGTRIRFDREKWEAEQKVVVH